AVEHGERHSLHAGPGLRRGQPGRSGEAARRTAQFPERSLDAEHRLQGVQDLHHGGGRAVRRTLGAQPARHQERDLGVHRNRLGQHDRIPRHARRAGRIGQSVEQVQPADPARLRRGPAESDAVRESASDPLRPAHGVLTMTSTPQDSQRSRMMTKRSVVVSGAFLALFVCGNAGAVRDVQELRLDLQPQLRAHDRDGARPLRTQITDNTQTIGVNNIRMFVTNTGSFAWDKAGAGQPAGFEFPKGTGKTALYAAGLWLGAKVNGALRLAVSEYSDEYRPGSAVGGYPPDDPTKAEYKVYKLDRVYNNPSTRDAALADYVAGAVPHGAPSISVQADGSLNTLGDEMMWAVYNDLDSTAHNNRADNLFKALGIEVQQTTFAFAAQGALNNTIFIKYKFINRGPWFLDQMYASQWCDPDLGGATDDLVGYDVPESLGFVYNATNSYDRYGSFVPSVRFDFFKGPIVAGSPLGLSSFNKYINATDPKHAVKTYNY